MYEKSIVGGIDFFMSPIDHVFEEPHNLPVITQKLNELPKECQKHLILHKAIGPIRFKYLSFLSINHNLEHLLPERQYSIQT